jgi:hypothetical protein
LSTKETTETGEMNVRHGAGKMIALIVMISLPVMASSGIASAAKNTAGSAKWCAHHHKLAKTTPSCASAGGAGTGTGSGSAGSAPITIQIDPNPAIETGTSDVAIVVQVEASASFAGDAVDLSSSQFDSSCTDSVGVIHPGSLTKSGGPGRAPLHVQMVLDDDGNATVAIFGTDCAPGSSVFEASLEVAPFLTALGTLIVDPPVVTPPGVYGFPTTSGTVTTGEVETGDTATSGDSDVYAVFQVETDPVYAEQQVEISAEQLTSRCLVQSEWVTFSEGTTSIVGTTTPTSDPVSMILDDDGNAVFFFLGRSCAAGSSEVIADVMAGSHPTYTTSFTVDPPAVTI